MSQKLYEEVFGGFSAEEIARLKVNKGDWLPKVKGILQKAAEKLKPFLRRLYKGEEIVIGPTDGTRRIAEAKDVFPGGIDPDFVNWGLAKPGKPRPVTKVEVLEMERDGTFRDLFLSLSTDPDRLVFEQDQVIDIVLKHPGRLHPEGWATFFLLRKGEEFFVTYVCANVSGQLGVGVGRFEGEDVWRARNRGRVVVPQLSS